MSTFQTKSIMNYVIVIVQIQCIWMGKSEIHLDYCSKLKLVCILTYKCDNVGSMLCLVGEAVILRQRSRVGGKERGELDCRQEHFGHRTASIYHICISHVSITCLHLAFHSTTYSIELITT